MKYAELMKLSLNDVRAYVAKNPKCISGGNALMQMMHDDKNNKKLTRIGKKFSVTNGKTKVKRHNKMPTKKALR